MNFIDDDSLELVSFVNCLQQICELLAEVKLFWSAKDYNAVFVFFEAWKFLVDLSYLGRRGIGSDAVGLDPHLFGLHFLVKN